MDTEDLVSTQSLELIRSACNLQQDLANISGGNEEQIDQLNLVVQRRDEELRHCRVQINLLLAENEDLKRQVKQLSGQDPLLSANRKRSMDSTYDIDYSCESLDEPLTKRSCSIHQRRDSNPTRMQTDAAGPSSSTAQLPHIDEQDENIVPEHHVQLPDKETPVKRKKRKSFSAAESPDFVLEPVTQSYRRRVRMRRSMSVVLYDQDYRRQAAEAAEEEGTEAFAGFREKQKCPATGFGPLIESREHEFASKRIFTRVVCNYCNLLVRFSNESSRCMQCKTIYHQHCRSKAPLPCIPYRNPPIPKEGGRPRLVAYCRDIEPRIPHVLVQCVLALEKNNLFDPRLYTLNNISQEDRELLDQILHSRPPIDFTRQLPEQICQSIVLFLSEVRECLILPTSFEDLITAHREDDQGKFDSVVNDLPQVHLTTLAFLMLHFQHVLAQSQQNHVTPRALAKIFLPVFFRNYIMDYETEFEGVFIRLLSNPSKYYLDLLSVKGGFNTPVVRTLSKKDKDNFSRSTTVTRLQQMGSIKR